MEIPRIDLMLFGYREVRVEKKDLKELLNILLPNGFSVKINDAKFRISERKFKKFKNLVSEKINFSATELRGLPGALKRYKLRLGIFSALILSLLLCIISSTRVWDIRIVGSELGNEEQILAELSELGFSVGSSWHKCDKNRLEADMLYKSKYVSWININQRGTVAYVSVIDKLVFEEEENTAFANIVASRDCVIEEITVSCGIATVRPGQTVKKGEILISGVIPKELGGGFCRAEGVVIGRFFDAVSVNISETKTENDVKEDALDEIKVKKKMFKTSLKD